MAESVVGREGGLARCHGRCSFLSEQCSPPFLLPLRSISLSLLLSLFDLSYMLLLLLLLLWWCFTCACEVAAGLLRQRENIRRHLVGCSGAGEITGGNRQQSFPRSAWGLSSGVVAISVTSNVGLGGSSFVVAHVTHEGCQGFTRLIPE